MKSSNLPYPRFSDSKAPAATSYNATLLGFWTCYFIDIPDDYRREAISSPVDGDNTTYSCFFKTKYLTGNSVGPTVCIILCLLIAIIGMFGVGANIVNILVLRHSMKGSSLQKLLLILAGFDLLACFFAFLASVMLEVILGNSNSVKNYASLILEITMVVNNN